MLMTDIQHCVVNDGCQIAYRHHRRGTGDRTTLVLSNSLGATMDMWQPQLPIVSEHYDVLCYDSRGHGQSEVFLGTYSIDRLGNDLVQLIDALELEKVHFCGLSIGGMIGQWLACRYPERIQSLVLANTAPYIGPASVWQKRIELVNKQGLESMWEAIRARWLSSGFIAAHTEQLQQLQEMFTGINPAGYTATCAAIRDMDMRAIMETNKLPTLIIAGLHDLATPIEQSELLHHAYADSRLLTLDACHLSNIEQAESFNEVVIRFLNGYTD